MTRIWIQLLTLSTGMALALPAAEPVDLGKRAEELKDLRWGMFMCWSLSSFSGKEWTPGVTNINLFAAKGCDTDQWARTAKKAGMGYILFLTKHHDGFCLWDTKTTDRKVTKTALGRDVLAELRKSCDKYGIKLALYFSEGEWAWPAKPDGTRFGGDGGHNPEMKKAQLKELLTQYGPIEFMWLDHAVGDGGLSHKDTVAWCHQCQPGTLIGFNHGEAAGEVRLGELGHAAPLDDASGAGCGAGDAGGSYKVAEFTYPILPAHEGGAMWFYSLPKHDNLCLPAEKLYTDYLAAVKFGNIFSIAVAPGYNGKVRAIDVATLCKVGDMIRHPRPAQTVTVSGEWKGREQELSKTHVSDGDFTTLWAAPEGASNGWVQIDLGEEREIVRAIADDSPYGRTRKFELKARVADAMPSDTQGKEEWKTLATGTTIGNRRAFRFDKVKARVFRLEIQEATDVPTIAEFQLLEE